MTRLPAAIADRAWRSFLAGHGLPYEPPIRERTMRQQAIAWRAFLKRHKIRSAA